MIKFKIKGDWRKATRLLHKYAQRMEWVRSQITKNVAENFLESLMKIVPGDSDFDDYRKSLKVVSLSGVKGGVAYAVVSDRSSVSVGMLQKEEKTEDTESGATVIYIEPTKGRGEVSPLAMMVIQNNPWPPSMIPHGIPQKEVMLVHQKVTKKEVDFARDQAKDFLSKFRPELRGAGATWKKTEETENPSDELESLPDYMSMALRSEFGINAVAHPHWRPVLKGVFNRVGEIIEKDDNIRRALYDELFRDHLKAKQKYPDDMSEKNFIEEAGEFQKKIANVIGGEIH